MINTPPIPGGWVISVTKNWSPFVDKAFEQLNLLPGTKYRPIAQVGTQVVAGLNVIAVGEQTIVGDGDRKQLVRVFFWAHPDHSISIISIEPISEQESIILPDNHKLDWADIQNTLT